MPQTENKSQQRGAWILRMWSLFSRSRKIKGDTIRNVLGILTPQGKHAYIRRASGQIVKVA